jgi:hypothetical protein
MRKAWAREEGEELEKRTDEKNATSSAAQDAIYAEYTPSLEELKVWRDAERDKVREEYRPKLEELSGTAREALEEECNLKNDAIELEYRKKYNLVYEEMAAKVDEAWK